MTKIEEHDTIWFPGIYGGRGGDYAKLVADVPEEQLIRLVTMRAIEDGNWAIENGHVGDNEDVMRKMMKWVGDPKNILQCARANPNETVDWICRDLANGSKWVGGSRD
jgi:hypothetical protein